MSHTRTHHPVGYLLTWTCYGTWLHGDDRGSTDRMHNAYGAPFLSTDHTRGRIERNVLTDAPVRLNDTARRVIARIVEDHCRIRGWTLHSLAVRSNHVHVVVTVGDASGERALVEFKAWSTRALRRADIHGEYDGKIWTKHGSTRYLWTPDSLNRAVDYVVNGQDDRSIPDKCKRCDISEDRSLALAALNGSVP